MKTLITTSILLFLIFSCNEKNVKKKLAKENIASEKITKEEYKNESIYKEEMYFEKLDEKTILTRLFESNKFDDSNYVHWLPSYDERQYLHLSYDGKCHTKIDTIMYFRDKDNEKCAVVIFGTYNFVRNYHNATEIVISDGHFDGIGIGVALFSYDDEKEWELYGFKKKIDILGYFGDYDINSSFKLKTMGQKWTCLSLMDEVNGSTGVLWGGESLFAIEKQPINSSNYEEGLHYNHILEKIFTYNYYYSEMISFETDECNVTERKLNFIKKKNDYYDIRLDIVKNEKRFTEYYYYDDFYNKYLLKK